MTGAVRDRALELLSAHAVRYPAWCIIDAYKLLYQACMGPGHAQGDPGTLRRRLLAEYAGVEARPDAVLLEDITLHMPLYRLHLAGAKARAVDPGIILEGFRRCMTSFPRRADILPQVWALALREMGTGRILVADAGELDAIEGSVCRAGYPAVSHSVAYRLAYAPAYRLVGALSELGERAPYRTGFMMRSSLLPTRQTGPSLRDGSSG